MQDRTATVDAGLRVARACKAAKVAECRFQHALVAAFGKRARERRYDSDHGDWPVPLLGACAGFRAASAEMEAAFAAQRAAAATRRRGDSS